MKLNLKSKISNYGFWISLLSVIFLVVKHILNTNGITFDDNIAIDIITMVCYMLITLGVISNPESGKGYNDIKKEVSEQIIETTSNPKQEIVEMITQEPNQK